MRSLIFAAILCASGIPAFAANPDRFCEEAKELTSITKQLPDYQLSWELETPAAVVLPLRFKPFWVLSAARGQPVCIALVVSETGRVRDAAAYYPKRVALSKKERDSLLSQPYTPAKQGGVSVKSIVVMKAWLK